METKDSMLLLCEPTTGCVTEPVQFSLHSDNLFS